MVGFMKNNWIPTVLLAMAILATGCSKLSSEDVSGLTEEEKPSGPAVTLTVSAATKGTDGATRIAYGTTNATWEVGDKIFLIKSDGTTITLTLADGAGEVSGTFTSTDPVVAGSYIPYAVSATSLSKGFVSLSEGVITLNLASPGGSTLADVLEHDILKGDTVVLEENQTTATITGLTTHILSYFRFRFASSTKAISSIGMDSAGGLYRSVTIATDGTVSGDDSSTGVFQATASNDGAGVYAGYFAIYKSTSSSLVAHAVDASGKSYSRLVTTKDVNYTPGQVYGKSITLSEDMVTSSATGEYGGQNWKDLGLSVRWAKFNVGSSAEIDYNQNIMNESVSVPLDWNGWRLPTRAESQELFYASGRSWITGEKNGVGFSCNGSTLYMGAGGYYRYTDNGSETTPGQGTVVHFYINEKTSITNGTAQLWASVGSEGTTLDFGYANLGSNMFGAYNYSAQRLVCDYVVQQSEAESDAFLVGSDIYDINDFETE